LDLCASRSTFVQSFFGPNSCEGLSQGLRSHLRMAVQELMTVFPDGYV
jgi:hypothetical protein